MLIKLTRKYGKQCIINQLLGGIQKVSKCIFGAFTLHRQYVFCLFEKTPLQKKESQCPVIRDFSSCLGLAFMVTPPQSVNPWTRINIPTSLEKVNPNTDCWKLNPVPDLTPGKQADFSKLEFSLPPEESQSGLYYWHNPSVCVVQTLYKIFRAFS